MEEQHERFMTLVYDYDPIVSKIKIAINPDSTKKVVIIANRDGMAHLASSLSDFVLWTDPNSLAFGFDSSDGVTSDSPRLVFDFDSSFDEDPIVQETPGT